MLEEKWVMLKLFGKIANILFVSRYTFVLSAWGLSLRSCCITSRTSLTNSREPIQPSPSSGQATFYSLLGHPRPLPATQGQRSAEKIKVFQPSQSIPVTQFGLLCPAASGHLHPMVTLGHALP